MYRKPIAISNTLIHHVNRMIKDLCELMQIEKPNKIFLFKDDFKSFTENKLSYDEYMKIKGSEKCILKGCYDPIKNNLFVNIKDHTCLDEIDQTIIHELIHIKDPKLNHGIRFNSLIEYYEIKLRSRCDHIFIKGFQFGSITSSKSNQRQKYKHKKLDSYYCEKCKVFLVYNKTLIKNLFVYDVNKDKPYSYFNKQYKLKSIP